MTFPPPQSPPLRNPPHLLEQEEFENAYQEALSAGLDPNGAMPPDDPNSVAVVRWVMDNSHCGWLIGKGGSGIKNIEVCVCARVWSLCVCVYVCSSVSRSSRCSFVRIFVVDAAGA